MFYGAGAGFILRPFLAVSLQFLPRESSSRGSAEICLPEAGQFSVTRLLCDSSMHQILIGSFIHSFKDKMLIK